MVLIQKLHLPHAELPQLIEVLEEPPLCYRAAVLLCPSPQVHQQPVLQRVYEGLFVGVRHPRLSVPLHLGIHRRQRQEIILIAEATDCPHIDESPLGCHLKDVNSLLLHRENGQDVLIEVQPLVMREDDFVTLESPRVAESARVEVNDMQGIIFQRGARVRGHRLTVAIDLKEGRVRLLRQVSSRANDDVSTVVSEQAALAVQVLPVRGHIGDMEQDEEALKEPPSDVDRSLVIAVSQDLPLVALQEVLCRLAALILVDLQGGLVGGEGDEVTPIGGELAQEAGRFLHVDHSEVGEDVLVEDADLVPVGAGLARADPTAFQAVDDVLVLDAAGLDCGGIMVHGQSTTSSSPCCRWRTHSLWDLTKAAYRGGVVGKSTTSRGWGPAEKAFERGREAGREGSVGHNRDSGSYPEGAQQGDGICRAACRRAGHREGSR